MSPLIKIRTQSENELTTTYESFYRQITTEKILLQLKKLHLRGLVADDCIVVPEKLGIGNRLALEKICQERYLFALPYLQRSTQPEKDPIGKSDQFFSLSFRIQLNMKQIGLKPNVLKIAASHPAPHTFLSDHAHHPFFQQREVIDFFFAEENFQWRICRLALKKILKSHRLDPSASERALLGLGKLMGDCRHAEYAENILSKLASREDFHPSCCNLKEKSWSILQQFSARPSVRATFQAIAADSPHLITRCQALEISLQLHTMQNAYQGRRLNALLLKLLSSQSGKVLDQKGIELLDSTLWQNLPLSVEAWQREAESQFWPLIFSFTFNPDLAAKRERSLNHLSQALQKVQPSEGLKDLKKGEKPFAIKKSAQALYSLLTFVGRYTKSQLTFEQSIQKVFSMRYEQLIQQEEDIRQFITSISQNREAFLPFHCQFLLEKGPCNKEAPLPAHLYSLKLIEVVSQMALDKSLPLPIRKLALIDLVKIYEENRLPRKKLLFFLQNMANKPKAIKKTASSLLSWLS
ncbi:MAG: hypothetical protein K0S07_389 [Chlamydiales bacterium]|jgi:hypothetical protein|nr:hypothetical protein [Chlamydiales bacterium]